MNTDVRDLVENAVPSTRVANVTGSKAHRRKSLNRLLKVSGPVMALIVVIVLATFPPTRLGSRSAGAVPGWIRYDDEADGLSISLPPAWKMAASNLTPTLLNPRELVALGTYALTTNPSSELCPQVPAAALNAMGSRNAFISIMGSEPSANSQSDLFPARPAQGFTGSSGVNLSRTDLLQCLAHPLQGNGQLIAFSQAGRDFYVLTAIGTSASATLRWDVYTILDSIEVAQS